MSYDIYIYHLSVHDSAINGDDSDGVENAPFGVVLMGKIKERLVKHGYGNGMITPIGIEFIKEVGECPIQVIVFTDEVVFSVPYWDNNEEALAEVLMDCAEIISGLQAAVYNPQEGSWLVG